MSRFNMLAELSLLLPFETLQLLNRAPTNDHHAYSADFLFGNYFVGVF